MEYLDLLLDEMETRQCAEQMSRCIQVGLETIEIYKEGDERCLTCRERFPTHIPSWCTSCLVQAAACELRKKN